MFELFGCHCNPQMAVGLDEGSPAPSGELLGCGPHGGLQLLGTCRGIVWWWGSSGGGEGCAACAQPLPVPSPCLLSVLHPQLCLWPGAAQPFVSLP